MQLALELSAVAWRAYLYGGDSSAIGGVASRALQIVKEHPVRLGQIVLGFAALTEAFLPGENEYDARIEALLRSLENTNCDRQLSDDALGLGICAAWQREDVKRARRFEALVRAPKHGSTIGAAGECREFILERLAALQGHTLAARTHFAKARGDLERAGQVCLRALVDLDEAIVTGTSGDKPSSHALLQRGREQFVALGMRSLAGARRSSAVRGSGDRVPQLIRAGP